MSDRHGRYLALTLAMVIPMAGTAQTPTERGLEIVREMDARNRGFKDFEATLTMTIHDRADRARTRELLVRGLEAEDGDRTMVVLVRPADLAGTAFLTVQRSDGQRAQWLYLPSQARARRIGGSQASDSFLGSHFTYADLAAPAVEGFDYRWIRDEVVAGSSGVVVERTRTGDDLGDPARSLLWIDMEQHRIHRIDYYDESGSLARTLDISEYSQIGGFWRPARMVMRLAGSEDRTVLEWSGMRLGVGLEERDFDPSRLGR